MYQDEFNAIISVLDEYSSLHSVPLALPALLWMVLLNRNFVLKNPDLRELRRESKWDVKYPERQLYAASGTWTCSALCSQLRACGRKKEPGNQHQVFRQTPNAKLTVGRFSRHPQNVGARG